MSKEGNEVLTANDYPNGLWKIIKALNKAKTARIPGINRQTIYRKIKEHKISNSKA
jgi:transcriptional regulator of acetoin/glycerol metabolism